MAYALQTLDQEFSALAKRMHCSKKKLINQALVNFLEDQKDVELAHKSYEDHKKSGRPFHSLNDVMRELGFDEKNLAD